MKHTSTAPPASPADATIQMYLLSIGPRDTWVHWEAGGFSWLRWRAAVGGSSRTRLVLPLWSVAAAAALPLMAWLTFHCRAVMRRRKRRLQGFCTRCGYDLRATRHQCPECGLAFAR